MQSMLLEILIFFALIFRNLKHPTSPTLARFSARPRRKMQSNFIWKSYLRLLRRTGANTLEVFCAISCCEGEYACLLKRHLQSKFISVAKLQQSKRRLSQPCTALRTKNSSWKRKKQTWRAVPCTPIQDSGRFEETNTASHFSDSLIQQRSSIRVISHAFVTKLVRRKNQDFAGN